MLDLKPIYNTGTITFVESHEKITLKKIDSTCIKDPEGIIPNGIYKVFKHEKDRQIFLLCFFSLIVITMSIYVALLRTIFLNRINQFWMIPTILIIILSIWKIILLILETKHLRQSISMYRESLVLGSRLTPPFISNLYINLYKVQVKQNWIVISFLFYGTIFTLLFWWLKDINWWIFKFKDWIANITKNPQLVGFILIFILFMTLIFYIYFTVYRKKRIIDIQSFFGNEVISQTEIEQIVRQKNKVYRRAFLISILVFFVLPFFGWIIYKKFIKKK